VEAPGIELSMASTTQAALLPVDRVGEPIFQGVRTTEPVPRESPRVPLAPRGFWRRRGDGVDGMGYFKPLVQGIFKPSRECVRVPRGVVGKKWSTTPEATGNVSGLGNQFVIS